MHRSDRLFVGLDCGGTRCRARLSNGTGAPLGEGHSGPANGLLGLDRAFEEIEKAVDEALRVAGLHDVPLSAIHAGLGMAGLCVAGVRAGLDAYPHPFASLKARTDAHIAQRGAWNGGDGAIVICGTGSCGYAVLDGKNIVKGGQGFKVSDQGSGALLGRKAVRRALQGFENILSKTPLCEAIMARFDNNIDTLISWAELADPADYGRFAPLVFDHGHNDELAAELIRDCARDIEYLIHSLINAGAPSVVLIGGMAAPITPWLSARTRAVLKAPLGDSLDGAVLLAQAGWEEIRSDKQQTAGQSHA